MSAGMKRLEENEEKDMLKVHQNSKFSALHFIVLEGDGWGGCLG